MDKKIEKREKKQDLVVEEFAIMELEDRLELVSRCNTNCSCPAPVVTV